MTEVTREINGGVFLKLGETYGKLGKAEKRVANFVKNYPEEILKLPINVLADKVGVSVSTVVRLCRRIGISGYADLKISLAQDLATHFQSTYAAESPNSNLSPFFDNARQRMIDSIENSLAAISLDDIAKVGKLLMQAGSILVIGTGGTAAIGELFNYNLIKLGFHSQSSTDFTAIPLIINSLAENDVLFAITHSGSTNSVDEAVKIAREQGCKVVSLTNYPESSIAKNCDVVLLTAVREMPLGSEGGPIRVAQIGVLDMLWLWLAREKQAF